MKYVYFGTWRVISGMRQLGKSMKVLCVCTCGFARWIKVESLLKGTVVTCRECKAFTLQNKNDTAT